MISKIPTQKVSKDLLVSVLKASTMFVNYLSVMSVFILLPPLFYIHLSTGFACMCRAEDQAILDGKKKNSAQHVLLALDDTGFGDLKEKLQSELEGV